MSTAAWRLAVESPAYRANDLSGKGAKTTGGRWNSIGTRLVYSSSSIALAALETLSYVRTGSLPYNRFLVRTDIPDLIWQDREILVPPAGWDAVPSGLTSKSAGDAWVASTRSAILLVPSVIVPEEFNILINPAHPSSTRITATTSRRWIFDPRIF
mgnify:CR=1 FL=1